MELKLNKALGFAYIVVSFNRTFMELKLEIFLVCDYLYFPFNRTFMELKQMSMQKARHSPTAF